jgi:hypothetical protein
MPRKKERSGSSYAENWASGNYHDEERRGGEAEDEDEPTTSFRMEVNLAM